MFITVHKKVRHHSLSWAKWIQYTPPHLFIYFKLINIYLNSLFFKFICNLLNIKGGTASYSGLHDISCSKLLMFTRSTSPTQLKPLNTSAVNPMQRPYSTAVLHLTRWVRSFRRGPLSAAPQTTAMCFSPRSTKAISPLRILHISQQAVQSRTFPHLLGEQTKETMLESIPDEDGKTSTPAHPTRHTSPWNVSR
jgi:hypothetical protein